MQSADSTDALCYPSTNYPMKHKRPLRAENIYYSVPYDPMYSHPKGVTPKKLYSSTGKCLNLRYFDYIPIQLLIIYLMIYLSFFFFSVPLRNCKKLTEYCEKHLMLFTLENFTFLCYN